MGSTTLFNPVFNDLQQLVIFTRVSLDRSVLSGQAIDFLNKIHCNLHHNGRIRALSSIDKGSRLGLRVAIGLGLGIIVEFGFYFLSPTPSPGGIARPITGNQC